MRMGEERRTVQFESNPIFSFVVKFVACLLIGALVGLALGIYFIHDFFIHDFDQLSPERRRFVLLGSATFGALAGIVIGGGAGLFRKHWRRQLTVHSGPHFIFQSRHLSQDTCRYSERKARFWIYARFFRPSLEIS